MRSPAKMKVITIEITNKCWLKCSNCTRFIGHHGEDTTYHMEYDFFKKAVDSLIDFPGHIGILGGDPVMHPEFEKFTKYLVDTIPDKSRRGLWSSLHPSFYKNLDLIKESYGYHCLNDHVNPSNHQPLLVAAKDIIKNKQQMWSMIDDCWIQSEWSASINPKGAFFCEVAAARDILFDGPGGWPVEPGWWKRLPTDKDFLEQKHRACQGCGAAMPLDGRRTDGRGKKASIKDDISISNLLELAKLNKSEKLKKNEIAFHDTNYSKEDVGQINDKIKKGGNWYVQGEYEGETFVDNDRLANKNRSKLLKTGWDYDNAFNHSHPQVKRKANPKIAVVIPFCTESDYMISRCIQSVKGADVILVNDSAKARKVKGVKKFIDLGEQHHDNGNFARYTGADWARNNGYDLIMFLDVDNWHVPGYIEALRKSYLTSSYDVYHCNRSIYNHEGKFMFYDDLESGYSRVVNNSLKYVFIDTSCLALTPSAYNLIDIWKRIPLKWSDICDDVFSVAIKKSSLSLGAINYTGIGFTTKYKAHYERFSTLNRNKISTPDKFNGENNREKGLDFLQQEDMLEFILKSKI